MRWAGSSRTTATHIPLAGAKVTVPSPSQNGSVLADASGDFAFLSLAPDTYAVTETLTGYDTSSISGTTVIADQTRALSVRAADALDILIPDENVPAWEMYAVSLRVGNVRNEDALLTEPALT